VPLRFVAVEKEHPSFQGKTERWSNVYCYEMPTVSIAAHEAIQQAVLDAEKNVHATDVKFVRTRVFTTDATEFGPGGGTMYSIVERNTFGTLPTSLRPYLECAVLLKWPLPRKTLLGGGLGRQRSLKKWIHPCSGGFMNASELAGFSPLSQSAKDHYATFAAAVRTPTGGSLVSPSDGAEPSSPVIVHPYIEHRQFPRGRKED
jgi:hypothetical protein